MRVGVSLTSTRRANTPAEIRDGARWMIERAAAANEAGLDSLFVGDHHATPEAYYQNVPMMGRMLAEWGDRTAGCLFLLPLWNPVLLAEQIGTLAAIHTGRFVAQVGLGYGEQQFAAMGVSHKTRPSAFEESLTALRKLLAGETVSSDHRFHFKDATVRPIPPEPVAFWFASSGEPAIDRAARMGDGWLGAPGLSRDEAASQLSLYQERCQAHGREPGVTAIRRDIFVADTEEEAEEIRTRTAGYRHFDPSALAIGTIAQVAAQFRELAELGYSDVIIRHVVDDQPKVLASMARLKEVRAMVLEA
jgi:alkanesulfonate monooxygenase SsuD/methylene tetrahydromethanopterin reductase-like flavin-dependent oxidoreductase (luciferase family)